MRHAEGAFRMDFQRTRFRCGLVFSVVLAGLMHAAATRLENPNFSEPIANVTVRVGTEATLACVVQDLGSKKVAWVRSQTQKILTIHTTVIASSRYSSTHEDRNWYLHIHNVLEEDRGWYMCQINTDPMITQMGYLEVVVPPDIVYASTSKDMVVLEGSNVTLKCVAKGYPQPQIAWKRGDGQSLQSGAYEALTERGSVLTLQRVSRDDMGPYFCAASNGVPPAVIMPIRLTVHCTCKPESPTTTAFSVPPRIYAANQLVGAYDGMEVTLECQLEAFPRLISYWTKDNGDIVPQSKRIRVNTQDLPNYQANMSLTIFSVNQDDYGTYHCICKSTNGDAQASIKLYDLDKAHLNKSENADPADPSRKDSLLLGDGHYSSAEVAQEKTAPLLLFTSVMSCLSTLRRE